MKDINLLILFIQMLKSDIFVFEIEASLKARINFLSRIYFVFYS